jgi:glutathionyl-hydroquinone reductase
MKCPFCFCLIMKSGILYGRALVGNQVLFGKYEYGYARRRETNLSSICNLFKHLKILKQVIASNKYLVLNFTESNTLCISEL